MSRNFKTDYAGSWCGYCVSRESAIAAAQQHILNDGYTRCTITDLRTNQDVAWLRVTEDRCGVVVKTSSPLKRGKGPR